MSQELELGYCKYLLNNHDDEAIVAADPDVFQSSVTRTMVVWAKATREAGFWPSEALLLECSTGENHNLFRLALDSGTMPADHKAILKGLNAAHRNTMAVKALNKAIASVEAGNLRGIITEVSTVVADCLDSWDCRDFADVMEDVVAGRPLRANADNSKLFYTGIGAFDGVIGAAPRTYGAICAMPGVGKTSLMLQCAVASACQGVRTVALSLETSRDVLEARAAAYLVAQMGGAQHSNTILRRGAGAIPEGVEGWGPGYLQIAYHPAGIEWEQLTAKIRSYAQQDYQLFLLDYFSLIEPAQIKGKQEFSCYAEMSKGIKTLAAELKVCIVVIVQPNGDVDYGVKPSPKNLGNTKQIFRDYDWGIYIWSAKDEDVSKWKQEGALASGVPCEFFDVENSNPVDADRINHRLLKMWLHKNRDYAGDGGNPEPEIFADWDPRTNLWMEADYLPTPEVGDANPNKKGRMR